MGRKARAVAAAKAKKDDGKKKQSQPTAAQWDEDASSERKRQSMVMYESNETKARKVALGNTVKDRAELPPIECYWSDDEIEDNVPFCCNVCHCPEEVKENVMGNAYAQPDSGDIYLFHRSCCHGLHEILDVNWCPPYMVAERKFEELKNSLKNFPTDELVWVEDQQIRDAFKTCKAQNTAVLTADGYEHLTDQLNCSEEFLQAAKRFDKCVQDIHVGRSSLRRCVVLDCFAGIGTGLVVLKRLNIDVAKVIYVEHDKVARHVYRSNHDHMYNKNLSDDGIKHVYIEKFEELTDNVETFLQEHGPIDVVLGGPPCVDFSPVNAYRQGVKGQQGQYMIEFAQFIRELERLQQPHPLWFLVENVVLRGDDLFEARDAFGIEWNPVELDALYLSPMRRNRHFFVNYRLQDIDYEGPASESVPACCLEEGFDIPALRHTNSDVDESNDIIFAKAQCFMASSSRIDEVNSLRMYVFNERTNHGTYHGRPMKVFERENLMGYPERYVEPHVKELFKTLKVDALSHLQYKIQKPWIESLDEKYYEFAGNYHRLPWYNLPKTDRSAYQFEVTREGIETKMAPPCPETSTPTFFTAEDYSKHLIGLAYSVPVVEALLKPLQTLFLTKTYRGYDYRYKWEPESTRIGGASERPKVGDQPPTYAAMASRPEQEHFNFDDSTSDHLDIDNHYDDDSSPFVNPKPIPIIASTCAGTMGSKSELEYNVVSKSKVARSVVPNKNIAPSKNDAEVICIWDDEPDDMSDSKPPATSRKDTNPKSKMEFTTTNMMKEDEKVGLSSGESKQVPMVSETKKASVLAASGNQVHSNSEERANEETNATSATFVPLQQPSTTCATSATASNVMTMQEIMSFDPFSEEILNSI